MRKKITFVLTLFSLFAATAQNDPFTLSEDGKTLKKWTGSETTINMADYPALAGIEAIGNGAFEAKSLESIVILEGVKTIEQEAFRDCENLKKVSLPSTLSKMGEGVFRNCALDSIVIPEGVEILEKSSFVNCTSLKYIKLPSTLKKIMNAVFQKCSFESIVIPEGVTEIGMGTFMNCTDLKKISLPSTLTTIGKTVFWRCENLKEIICFATEPPKLEVNTFRDLKLDDITLKVPSGCKEAYEAEEIWKEFKIQVDSDVLTYTITFDSDGGSEVLPITATGGTKATAPAAPIKTGYTFKHWVKGEETTAFDFENTEITENISLKAVWAENPFTLSDDGKTLLKWTGSETAIIMADYPDLAAVEVIAKEAFKKSDLESIVIQEGVKEIGESAFLDCKNLKEVSLPSTLEKMDKQVFMGNTALESIVIPEGIEILSQASFSGCTNLKQVQLPSALTKIMDDAFRQCAFKSIVIPKGVTEIGSSAFSTCESLEKISLPSTLTTIKSLAFESCKNLKEIDCLATAPPILDVDVFKDLTLSEITIEVPSGCKGVYEAAEIWKNFKIKEPVFTLTFNSDGGTEVAPIKVPSGTTATEPIAPTKSGYIFKHWVKEGETTAFDFENTAIIENTSLKAVWKTNSFKLSEDGKTLVKWTGPEKTIRMADFPDLSSVVTIGKDAFFPGVEVDTIFIHEGVKTIAETAFKYCSAKYIKLPSSLAEIGVNAFERARQLESIVIPEGIEIISERAFWVCENLKKVSLPSTLKKLGMMAFASTILDSIVIPQGVTDLGYYTFAYVSSLKYIELPNNLTILRSNVFHKTGFESFNVPEGVEELDDRVFSFSKNLKSVKLPSSLKKMGEAAFQNCALDSIIIPEGVDTLKMNLFAQCKNLKYVKFPSTLTAIGRVVFEETGLDSITIPEGITAIEYRTFNKCSNLKKINLPSTLNKIGEMAFEKSALDSIVIPEGVKELERKAFQACKYLKKLSLPSTLTKIGSETFKSSGLDSIILLEGVTEIDTYAFENCKNLKKISLPNTLNKIGREAFAESTNLKEVISFSVVPPTLDQDVFKTLKLSEIVLKVPSGCMATYQGTEIWKNFKIEEFATYTLTFDSNGGTEVPSIKLLEGNTAVAPAVPTKAGHIFKHWVKEGENSPFDFAATPITADITLKAEWELNTSVEQIRQESANVHFYPSPVKNQLTIECEKDIKNYVVYNITGLEILRKETNDMLKQINIDMSNFPKGIYFVRLNTSGESKTLKVIKE